MGVYDAFMAGSETAIELLHGYTYSAHPRACAAGLAALDVYRDQGIFENAAAMAPKLEDAAHALRDLPGLLDIRTIGILAAIDMAPRPGAPGARGSEVAKGCLADGVMLRTSGDTLVISPPLMLAEDVFGGRTHRRMADCRPMCSAVEDARARMSAPQMRGWAPTRIPFRWRA